MFLPPGLCRDFFLSVNYLLLANGLGNAALPAANTGTTNGAMVGYLYATYPPPARRRMWKKFDQNPGFRVIITSFLKRRAFVGGDGSHPYLTFTVIHGPRRPPPEPTVVGLPYRHSAESWNESLFPNLHEIQRHPSLDTLRTIPEDLLILLGRIGHEEPFRHPPGLLGVHRVWLYAGS